MMRVISGLPVIALNKSHQVINRLAVHKVFDREKSLPRCPTLTLYYVRSPDHHCRPAEQMSAKE